MTLFIKFFLLLGMTMSCTLVSHDMQSTAALSNKTKMAKKAINK